MDNKKSVKIDNTQKSQKGNKFNLKIYEALNKISGVEALKEYSLKNFKEYPDENKRVDVVFTIKTEFITYSEPIFIECTTSCRADRINGKHHSARVAKEYNKNSKYILVFPDDNVYSTYKTPEREIKTNNELKRKINNKTVLTDIDKALKESEFVSFVDGLCKYNGDVIDNQEKWNKLIESFLIIS